MYNLKEATAIAEKYADIIRPYCERVEIAGSIRRAKTGVKDIELVCIPRAAHLEQYFIENNNKYHITKNGYKYKRIFLIETIVLDLFICSRETWVMNYFIRTGSADYIKRMMIAIKKIGYYSKDAQLYRNNGELVPLKEEKDFYNTVGIHYISPELRI